MEKYNQVYGNYTFGTGSWMDDELYERGVLDPYDDEVIKSYVSQVSKDLDRIGVLDSVTEFSVLDVGTGRQALAFSRFPAKSIQHYDISEQNIQRFQSFLKSNKVAIVSRRMDISSDQMVESSVYDLIYLQGVIQHVKDPNTAIFNLARSCKLQGIMWLYHYQCGSPVHIYAEVAREIMGTDFDLDTMLKLYKIANLSPKVISNIMDNIGCSYRYLLKTNYYKQCMERYGFRQFYRKDIANDAEGLDISATADACIGGYRKEFDEPNKVKEPNLPVSVDHLEPKNYIDAQRQLISDLRNIRDEIKRNVLAGGMTQLEVMVVILPLLKAMTSYRASDSTDKVSDTLIRSFSDAAYFSKKT